jgi:glucose-1-phosphate thymidylyltransferase
MKNIIIAAGYATRLYPLTENFPKPLLKIGESTILDRMLDDVDRIEDIDEHLVVTNHKFAPVFEEWARCRMAQSCGRSRKPVRIIDDGTSTNETRLGAVRDLLLVLTGHPDGNKLQNGADVRLTDDFMVLAADNILDFSFQGFVDYFKQKQTSIIMCYNEPELRRLQRTGVIRVDSDMRVLEMQEKPEHPVSNWAVPPFYIYKESDLPLITGCLAHGCAYDAPGNLARYMVEHTAIHAYPMPGSRYDIGSLDSYYEAQQLFG